MGDVDTPRLDPGPESAALPVEGMPSPDEAADGLLDEPRGEPMDVDRVASDLGLELPDDPSEATAVMLRSLVESRQEAGEGSQDSQKENDHRLHRLKRADGR